MNRSIETMTEAVKTMSSMITYLLRLTASFVLFENNADFRQNSDRKEGALSLSFHVLCCMQTHSALNAPRTKTKEKNQVN